MESASRPNGSHPGEAAVPLGGAERLRQALREARIDDAEHSRVVAELRGAEVARLEMLRDELQPILAEVPKEVDLFDLALVPSERPRLFIDMIAFAEMAHDRRTYRFVQDTRLGRVAIAESERLEPMIEAITDYVARRLIERDKALAGDTTLERAARAQIEAQEKLAARHPAAAEAPKPRRKNLFGLVFGFFIEFFGSAVVVALIGLGGWTAWKYIAPWLAQHHGLGH
ncbi:hypothetical protein [uncultured Methylovirgula sp.]|uniref:hypothetical protein n=1 Tax=uncultured Methylovirgula sp. TaxID=1285960 RepID=UPI0026386500|nr:hypothetical protein [uncultured Methylovirgula sp.]